jgi:hypothetical protein
MIRLTFRRAGIKMAAVAANSKTGIMFGCG